MSQLWGQFFKIALMTQIAFLGQIVILNLISVALSVLAVGVWDSLGGGGFNITNESQKQKRRLIRIEFDLY